MVFAIKVKFSREQGGKTFRRRMRSHAVLHALHCT